MRNTLPFALFALYPLGVSGIALIWLYRAKKETWFGWSVRALASGTVIAFIFLTGSWAFTSYYLRFLVLGLYAFVGIVSFPCKRRVETQKMSRVPTTNLFSMAVITLFLVLNVLAVAARYSSGESIDIAFPLRNGNYYVLQGAATLSPIRFMH